MLKTLIAWLKGTVSPDYSKLRLGNGQFIAELDLGRLNLERPTLSKILTMNGGPLKRMDEGRELLELIQLEAPNLLKEAPWIEGWITASDEVFFELVKLQTAKSKGFLGFLRKWPIPNTPNVPKGDA